MNCFYCNTGTSHWDGFDCWNCGLSFYYYDNKPDLYVVLKCKSRDYDKSFIVKVLFYLNKTLIYTGAQLIEINHILYFNHPSELFAKAKMYITFA